jgi:hypothetical protein
VSFAEGTIGSDSRREVADAKQDAIENRSKEIKVDKNPNLLDMSCDIPPLSKGDQS